MSYPRPERASKIRAIANMADLIEHLAPVPETREKPPLTLRFPKAIWNSYSPGLSAYITLSLNTAAGRKRKSRGKSPKHEGEPVPKVPKRSSTGPRQCKIKIWRFQYGGPEARVGGKDKNMVALDAPCLRETCANCHRWYAHLMSGPLSAGTSQGGRAVKSSRTISPAAEFQVPGKAGDQQSHLYTAAAVPIFLVASATSRDFLGGDAGREMFAAQRHFNAVAGLLSLQRGPSALQMGARDGLGFESGSRSVSGSDADERRPRRRYRVKMSFGTERGREDFRRMVERHFS